MFLHLSFKKIVEFVLKVVIWPFKAKKWSCRLSLTVAPNTDEKLGIELSFSSSLDTLLDSRQNETLLSYHPTFSVVWRGNLKFEIQMKGKRNQKTIIE